MEQFEIGDKVELNQNYDEWPKGTRGTVTDTERNAYSGLLSVTTDQADEFGSTNMAAFAFRFNKVTKPEVKAGDTVSLEFSDGSRIVDREVTSVYAVMVGKRQEYLNDLLALGWTLTDHQPAPEPEPQLPTRTLTIVATGNEWDRSRAVLLSDGKWYFGGHTSEYSETHPDLWSGGWRVVYDPTEADA